MPPVSAFIGRDAERARLAELLVARPMVTVVGAGGMGKTRLATEVAEQLRATFPGGVHRCELASLAPRDDLAAEVAGQLGFASLDAFLVGVDDARALIVLDNCEHVLVPVARVCAWLLDGAPALHVLATSRAPLGVDGEELLVLGPLGLPAADDGDDASEAPAVRLFADRARAAGATWDVRGEQHAAVVELCRRLDGVPLAIELAAARARALTATELLAHLDRRFDLLRRTSPVGRARHASLRDAIDASYELLEPEERRFFRALATFAGPFDAALAHAVAAEPGDDPVDAVEMLSRLVDRSLVVADQAGGTTLYRLLDSLRHYARDQAVVEGEWERLGERLVTAMIALAERYVVEGTARWSASVFEGMMRQLANLVAAVDACIARDADASRAVVLLLPLWGAVHQGRAAEIVALADRLFARWPEGREPLRAEACAVAATAYLVAGRIADARSHAGAALELAPDAALARALALRALGLAARHQGDLPAARSHFERAREVAAACGVGPLDRELATFAASVAGLDGDLGPALASLDRLADAGRAASDTIAELWARLVQAHLCTVARRAGEARTALEAAERIQTEIDYPFGAKLALRVRAALAALDGGWEAARSAYLVAVERLAALGDLPQLGHALREAAAFATEAGDDGAAEVLRDAVPDGVHVAELGALTREEQAAEVPVRRPAAGVRSATEALRRARAVLLGRDGAAAAAAGAAEAQGELVREGDGWRLVFAGRSARVRHVKGIDDLVVLLRSPEREVHCLELVGGTDAGGGAAPDVDDRARRQYKERVRELQAEIDEARDANDPGRAESAERELDALVRQLSEAFGLAGRPRATGSAAERARSAVTWRVRSAIKRIAEPHPELARHLTNAVHTGTWCVYRPERPVAWRLETSSR